MTPLRRILSVLLALVLALVGHVVLWTGGVPNGAFAIRGRGEVAALPLLVALVGAVIVAAAVLTVVISSTGVVVVGIIDIVASLLTFLAVRALFTVVGAVDGLSRDWGSGVAQSLAMGVAALTGTIFLAAGLAGRARRRVQSGAVSRSASVLVALVGIGVGIPLVIAGGGEIYGMAFMRLQTAPQVIPILLVLAGAVLVGAGVYAARLSSAGTLFMGAVVSIAGIIGLVDPVLLSGLVRPLDRGMAQGIFTMAGSGNLAMIGLVILAAGVGIAVRARSARASV